MRGSGEWLGVEMGDPEGQSGNDYIWLKASPQPLFLILEYELILSYGN